MIKNPSMLIQSIMDKVEPIDWSQDELLNPPSPSELKNDSLKQPTLDGFSKFMKRKSIVKKSGL